VSGIKLATGGTAVGPLPVGPRSHHTPTEWSQGMSVWSGDQSCQGRSPDGLLELSQEIPSLGIRGESGLLLDCGGRAFGWVFGDFCGQGGKRGSFRLEGVLEISQGGLEEGGAGGDEN